MKTDGAIHRRDLTITEDTTLEGMVMGTVRVQTGVLLILRGSVAKDLLMAEGTRLELYGQVGGDILNKGLIVHNSGKVGGSVVE